MAGHSKWANIKHRKAAQDAKRGKVFTRIIKEITVAARASGGDPDSNPRLRTLIEKAKQVNMPQENITRAIKKGTGELPGVTYEEQLYEGYGPGGIAVIVETLTDNKNRTVAALRHAFASKGGNLSEAGSVSWLFERMGVIKARSAKIDENALLELLIDYAISDLSSGDDGLFFITCEPSSMEAVKQALLAAGMAIEGAELEWVPKTTMELSDADGEKAIEFLNDIEDVEDVQNVYTNLG